MWQKYVKSILKKYELIVLVYLCSILLVGWLSYSVEGQAFIIISQVGVAEICCRGNSQEEMQGNKPPPQHRQDAAGLR